ncbi:MAG: uridine kinase [Prochlorococcus sp. SP3034]|nr:uridine kinase [Prochlorococcus sp. SP3034]|tara:strand:- start:15416 stop:16021 length:606 start_codon:yes stop_codon:yes gene_type:complete
MKLIIITGPTGSGKSTLSNILLENLDHSFILSTDNFYKTGFISNVSANLIEGYYDKVISQNKKLIKEEIISIIKNKSISHFYRYDFKKKKRVKLFKDINRIDYLIIEGIFALDIIELIKNNEFLLVNLKTSKKECKERICIRDYLERGKSKRQCLDNFTKAWDIYKRKERNFNFKEIKHIVLLRNSFEINKILKILSKKLA